MGGWNALFMAAAAGLYLGPIQACLSASPLYFEPFCGTATDPVAAVGYKIFSFPFFLAVQLIAFQDGRDRRTAGRLAFLSAFMLVAAALILHTPYFLFPGSLVYRHSDEMIAFDSAFLFLFIAWTACHRMVARQPRLWAQLDPEGVIPAADRHRALFWHPTIALMFHHFAGSTNQLTDFL